MTTTDNHDKEYLDWIPKLPMDVYPTAATRYVKEAGRIRTKTSRRSFLAVMSRLQQHIGGTPLEEVTTEQLTRFCLEPHLAPNTSKHRRANCRAFFEWAAWAGLVDSNPASDLKFTVQVPTRQVRLGNWYSEGDISMFLASCDEDHDRFIGQRDRILLMIGFLTGLRGAEIADLRWSSFSPDMNSLTVLGKGQKLATIAVPPQLRSQLVEWRRQVPDGSDVVLPSCKDTSSRHVDGTANINWQSNLTYDGIYLVIKKIGRRTGRPELAPHDMRRTFAALLESKGVPVTDISRAMRHGDVGITSKYLDKNPAKAVAVTAGFTLNI